MQPGQQQRRTNEDECPHLAARQLEVFGTVGKPLTTSLAGREPVKSPLENSGGAWFGGEMPGEAAGHHDDH
jgi:hypothetical protein